MKLVAIALSFAALAATAPAHADDCAEAGTAKMRGKQAAKSNGFIATASKKSGSGIEVSYRLDGRPAAGQPLDIVLRFANVNAEDASFTVSAPDGLQLGAVRTQALSAGPASESRVTVTVPGSGAYLLNVATTQGGRTSFTAVPVTVGNAKRKASSNGNLIELPGGERVVSMPAQ